MLSRRWLFVEFQCLRCWFAWEPDEGDTKKQNNLEIWINFRWVFYRLMRSILTLPAATFNTEMKFQTRKKKPLIILGNDNCDAIAMDHGSDLSIWSLVFDINVCRFIHKSVNAWMFLHIEWVDRRSFISLFHNCIKVFVNHLLRSLHVN